MVKNNFLKTLKQKLKELTIFDFVIIGIFLFGVVFFALVFFRKPSYVDVTIKVGDDNVIFWNNGVRNWFSEMFVTGLSEKDGLGRVQAEVVDVLSYDSTPNRNVVSLKVRLRTVYTPSTDRHTYKGKPVIVGQILKFQLDDLKVDGLITSIEGKNDGRAKEQLVVEARLIGENSKVKGNNFIETNGVMDFIADSVNVGDKILDNQKNIFVEVISKKVENAKKVVSTATGQVIVQEDPLLKDVYLTLKINAFKLNEKYYLYDDVPILVGQEFALSFPSTTILPMVTKITLIK